MRCRMKQERTRPVYGRISNLFHHGNGGIVGKGIDDEYTGGVINVLPKLERMVIVLGVASRYFSSGITVP